MSKMLMESARACAYTLAPILNCPRNFCRGAVGFWLRLGATKASASFCVFLSNGILASSGCYKGKRFILCLPVHHCDKDFSLKSERHVLHFNVSSEIRKTCASLYVFLSIAVTKVSSETCMHEIRPRHFVPLPTPLRFPPVRPRGPGTTLLVLGFGGRPRLDSTPCNIIMA